MDWQEYRQKATAARNIQMGLQSAMVVGSAKQYVESVRQTQELEAQSRTQEQILASQRQAAAAQHQAAEAQKKILDSQQRLMAEAARQTAVLREARDAELEAKSQQMKYQFAVWRQTGDGQAYLDWERDAGEYLTYMRSLQTQVSEAEAADHERLSLLTENLRAELLKTHFEFSSAEARQSYERDCRRYGSYLTASKSEQTEKLRRTSRVIRVAVATVFLLACLGAITWAGARLLNFVTGGFADGSAGSWLMEVAKWTAIVGGVLGLGGLLWGNAVNARIPVPVPKPEQKHYGRTVYFTVTDSVAMREEYDTIIDVLERLGIDSPNGLADHIRKNRRFTLPYSLNALCGFDVPAKITEVERFIEAAPAEMPTEFPDLPMPLFTEAAVNEQLAIAPVVHGQQVLMEAAAQV